MIFATPGPLASAASSLFRPKQARLFQFETSWVFPNLSGPLFFSPNVYDAD